MSYEEYDAKLEELKRRRLLELQRAAEEEKLRAERERSIQIALTQILTPEARQRLANLRMVKPDFVRQLELELIKAAQTGRIPTPITDEALKQILLKLVSTEKRETRIWRL
ncbi:MAG: DNA-binding protein [Nitrososphaerota archaeon]|nr:DNA-binding protein [Candidatus Bathyarchaeota archaeon]MCX8162761.1 DNA-binding protein [Candidatus Bathyarchaeota archaeon]MDW8061356.1 DNA-binding protein [Nitrososphaerota archaeon]